MKIHPLAPVPHSQRVAGRGINPTPCTCDFNLCEYLVSFCSKQLLCGHEALLGLCT